MRYQLPQFIETEVKVVGPFTLKQFLWIAGGVAFTFLLLITFKNFFAILLSLPVLGVSLALAFIKIDNVPLVNYVAYALSYTLNPKRYLFKNEQKSEIRIPSSK